MVNGSTKVLGLIGNPVAHTFSPAIHNTIASVMGINSIYEAFKVEESLDKAVTGAYYLGIEGMNVTVPHKKAVMGSLKEASDMALKIGAVNTLKRIDGGYKGFNTDSYGFERELMENGISVTGRDVIMLGAGGAANAVYHTLVKLGADHIYLLNRSVEKAREVFGGFSDVSILTLGDYKSVPDGKYVCVQCTSVGLGKDSDKAAIEDEAFYELIEDGVDLIYNPKETLFMKKVTSHGGRAFNGLDMLLYQAVKSYEIFMDVIVSDEAVSAAREVLKGIVWEK
ncbi:MAG: shikimate dehydrogenase [Lachnospiraceae bacterium]|nr:shikimate dehydrogenase [Lachnospiraceae bacterium]